MKTTKTGTGVGSNRHRSGFKPSTNCKNEKGGFRSFAVAGGRVLLRPPEDRSLDAMSIDVISKEVINTRRSSTDSYKAVINRFLQCNPIAVIRLPLCYSEPAKIVKFAVFILYSHGSRLVLMSLSHSSSAVFAGSLAYC